MGPTHFDAPAQRRLTGGWAFLLSFLVAGLLEALPWYSELFPEQLSP